MGGQTPITPGPHRVILRLQRPSRLRNTQGSQSMLRRHTRLALTLALFAFAACSLPQAGAAVIPGVKQRPLYVPGHVIVKYKLDTEVSEHLAALQMLAAKEEHALGSVPRLNLVQLPADRK